MSNLARSPPARPLGHSRPCPAAHPDWEEAFETAYQALHRRAEAFVALDAAQDPVNYAARLREIGEMT